ncbi:NADPH-dependent F420 reductase [bacterium]|nr:NADPH-dependent F420 reductase [bacterium]
MKCAVVGGTGWQGAGIATRIAYAGNTALIGSRDIKRSQALARGLAKNVGLPEERFIGMTNEDAVKEAEVVFITVPMTGHREILEKIAPLVNMEQLIVDVTAPVDPKNQLAFLWPPEGSATEEAQAILGEDIDVVGAFKNVSATCLLNHTMPSNSDILVVGDDLQAKHEATLMIKHMGFTAYDAGNAEAARVVEGMTQVLIYLNYAYHLNQPGIRIEELRPGMEIMPDERLFEYE